MSHCYGNTSNCAAGDLDRKVCSSLIVAACQDTRQFRSTWGCLFCHRPGNSDNEDAFYYSAATDPWGSVVASTPTGNQTIVFRYPSGALFPEGTEAEITVWDQSTGWVVGFYRCCGPQTGLGLPVASGCGSTQATACSIPTGEVSASANLFTAQDYGYNGSGGTTPQSSDQLAPAAAMLRHQELVNGTIHHALIFTVDCINSSFLNVFPVLQGGFLGKCGNPGFGTQNSNRAPAGALFFVDYTPAQIASFNLPAWQTTMLTTMATYGGYVGITGGSGIGLTMRGNEELESSEAWKYYYPSTFLTQDPFWAWANAQKGLDGSLNPNDTGCFGGSGGDPSTYRCEGAMLSNIPRTVTVGSSSVDVEGNACGVSPGCYPSGHIHMADRAWLNRMPAFREVALRTTKIDLISIGLPECLISQAGTRI